MKWIVLMVGGLSTLTLSACGEEPPPTEAELVKAANDVVAVWRERIEQRNEVYREIARAAAAVPVAELPPVDLGDGVKLPRSRTHPDRQEIDLKFLEDHTVDPFKTPEFLCMGGTSWYGSPLRWLEGDWGEIFRGRTTARLTEFMTEWCEEFLEPRYLLVYRTHEFRVPGPYVKHDEPKKGIIGEKIVGSYEAGAVAGDVLIFEVATKRFLGGVTYRAENSGQVDMARFRTDPGYLRTDLKRNAQGQVERALKPYVMDR